MKIKTLIINLAFMFVLVAVGPAGAKVTDVALYHLGEDDPGAAAGSTGNDATVDFIAAIDLTRFGNPTYRSETNLACSNLSMDFDGTGDYYQSAGGDVPTTAVDNVGMEAWCKANSFGAFQFVANLGWGGGEPRGFGLIEQGGEWRLLYNGVGYPAISTSASVTGEWVHLAGVIDGGTARLFVNGVEEATNTAPGTPGVISEVTDHMTIAGNPWDIPNGLWNGVIDHVRVFTFNSGEFQVGDLTLTCLPLDRAAKPQPTNGATDVFQDVTLSWVAPGAFIPTAYDLYVKGGDPDFTEGDVTVVGGIAPTAPRTEYDPSQGFAFGTTYYWRVDSYRPGFSDPCEGDVWSFTAEPVAYPIDGNNITATASSTHQADTGPENTINGLGLDVNDLHSIEPSDMWLSGEGDPGPVWIEYELDKAHKLHEMCVWNSNQMVESIIGFGIKDVTIEYSTNGTDYTILGTTQVFARAPGAPDYAHHTTVDFGGAAAKYVRLTVNSNWGALNLPQYGLSEVRFFSIPVFAREPSPDSGTT
ncbi:MAG: LamG-like jellyroll fold domain-containing protein, partial [Candidatus Neomarinimicrobiota bacterium]